MIARVSKFMIAKDTIEAAMSTMHESVLPELEKVEALISCIVTYNPDTGQGVATAVYENQATADEAQETIEKVWQTMGRYMSAPPEREVNDVLYVYGRR